MKNYLLLILIPVLMSSCTVSTDSEKTGDNPFFQDYNTLFQVPPFEEIQNLLYQDLRLRPGDEHPWRDLQGNIVETAFPQEVLKRKTGGPPLHQLVKLSPVGFGKTFFEVEEKFSPVMLGQVTKQKLGSKLGRIDSRPLQEILSPRQSPSEIS